MEITDQFYSNQNDKEIQNRISALGKDNQAGSSMENDFKLFMEFMEWKETKRKKCP
jgi:hypothetical protein